ncbi:MAG: VOC family protein [Rikenellaceae bacterium]
MKKLINEGSTQKSVCRNLFNCCLVAILLCVGVSSSYAQETPQQSGEQAKVVGLHDICVHVLKLEETLKLYREILGFKLIDSVVFKAPGLEGMLSLKLQAGDVVMSLSLTAPEYLSQVGPIGNTNHNHFVLKVNDIATIGDKLKAEGYALENDNYAKEKYTFFTGPNGEIIGLRQCQ